MAKPALATHEQLGRRFYVSDTSVGKLRERLVEAGSSRHTAAERDLANALDEAVGAAMDAKRSIEYAHEGLRQWAVDIEDYFGVPICVIVADNDSRRPDAPQLAIITVKHGSFYTQKKSEIESRTTLGDALGRKIIIPPQTVQGRPKETALITYMKEGRTQYEERAVEDIKSRLESLVDEGVAPSAIRVWKQAKTKLRLDVEL